MRVACVMMQRNEHLCLPAWLSWHGDLFGFENLYVLDHASDDEHVQETLRLFGVRGVQVKLLEQSAHYDRKGLMVSSMMLDVQAKYDFILPLDCDEFVMMRDLDGHPAATRDGILDYLMTLQGGVFEVTENFLNMLGHPGIFFALPYKKMFFRGGAVEIVDQGAHGCLRGNVVSQPTRLVYAHFHHKPYALQKAMAAQKLKWRVDVEDPAALRDYRGPGQHLIPHLFKTRDEYMAIMKPDRRCITFPALLERFRDLGIDPAFCDD